MINPLPWLAELIDRMHDTALTGGDWLTAEHANTDHGDPHR